MSLSRKVPALVASVAAAALLVAAPAFAQSSSMKLTSNSASPNSAMAKAAPTADARPSTTAQAPGGDKGGSLMAKAGNQLK